MRRETVTLPGSFAVEDPGPADILVTLDRPDLLRQSATAQLGVRLRNVSNRNVPFTRARVLLPAPTIVVNLGPASASRNNWLRIMKGWNYAVRFYRPQQAILDRTWTFPTPEAVT